MTDTPAVERARAGLAVAEEELGEAEERLDQSPPGFDVQKSIAYSLAAIANVLLARLALDLEEKADRR
jgi:hypothetical protein